VRFKAFLKQINDFRYLNKIIYTFLLYCESVNFFYVVAVVLKTFLGISVHNLSMKCSMNFSLWFSLCLSPFCAAFCSSRNFHDSHICKMRLIFQKKFEKKLSFYNKSSLERNRNVFNERKLSSLNFFFRCKSNFLN
jgi:hypothetical protein